MKNNYSVFYFFGRKERVIVLRDWNPIPSKSAVMLPGLFLLLSFLLGAYENTFSQVTVTYTQQQPGNYYTSYSSGASCGTFNQGSYQLGMFANNPAPKQYTLWRKFRTDAAGANTSDRSLQSGDQFVITLNARRAYGKIGFALLASPSTSSWADRESNYALSVNLDGPLYLGAGNWGNWYVKYSGGATQAASFGGQMTTAKNFTFTLTLTTPDRMNVSITDGTSTSNFYDHQLNTTNPITDYAVFLEDDYDGGVSQNVFWGLGTVGTQHQLTNTGSVLLGQSNNTFASATNISNGLDANSSSLNSLSNSVTKAGSGNVTVSGTNVYLGNTNLNAGTLTIGAAAALSSGSKLVFNGGNLGIGNVGAAAIINGNTLNFQSNANIDLGTSASTFNLNFANSSAEVWNAASTVTIYNWTPSAGKIINITAAGLTPAQLAKINFDNYGVGAKFVGNELRPALLFVTNGTGGGSFNTNASWLLGDKPTANDGSVSIYIQPGDNLTLNSPSALNFLRVEVGGTVNMANDNVTIFPSGDFRISGTVNMTVASIINMSAGINMIALSSTANFSAAGTLNFAGAFAITSNAPNAVLLPNVNLNASVDFGQNSTIQNGAVLTINSSGFVNNNAPFYATGATLKFNTGGNYGRNLEWSAISGKGYPYNVLVTNNTILDLGAWGGASVARQCAGSITIDAGSVLTMNQGGTSMNAALTVLKDVNVNGELRLGGGSGGNINIAGNYTFGVSGTVLNNGREVVFNGPTGNQLITRSGGGVVYLDYMVVDKTSGDLQLNGSVGNVTNAYIISTVDDLTKYVIRFKNGNIDLNDGIITLQGDASNSINIGLQSGGTSKIFTGTGTGDFMIRGAVATGSPRLNVVAVSGGSKLLFDNNIMVSTTVGVNFGAAGITTINAQLRIDQYGFVITNSPDYGPASTLIYNNGVGGYKRNMEWNTNTAGATGAGYPNNVIVQNNTPVELNSTDYPAPGPLGCSGKLNIDAGSSIITAAMPYTLSVGDSLNIKGTLTLSTNAAGDLTVGGAWNRTGLFVQNDRMVTFDSTNAASIKADGGQLFSRMTINKKTTASTLAVDSSVTITNELFLQSGTVNINNDITLTSDNTRTARIGETTDPGNISMLYNTGKFIIQRYLPIANSAAARRWRMLTAPLSAVNAPTINASWQEGQSSVNRLLPSDNNPGFGTAITRSTVAANGYDQGSTNNPSIYSYNTATNGWDALAATNAGKITDQPGYMIFVRGDRSIVVSNTSVPGTPTTLRTRGEINMGDVLISLNASGFQLLGNPYASAISFNQVDFDGVNPGVTAGKSFYLWDPKLPGANNVGGWITCTSLGAGVYAVTANGSGFPTDNTFTGTIESGAAIMVPVAGGNFKFSEPCKISASSTVGIASRPAGANSFLNNMDFLTCNLYSGTGNVMKQVDGVINIGSNDFDNEVNDRDAPKLVSFAGAEKISILRNGKKLSTELRKKIAAGDTIFYHLSRLYKGDYQLAFIGKGIDNSLVAIAEDKYTGTKTALNMNDTSFIRLGITDDTASAASDRFIVVFKSAAAFTDLTATLLNKDVVAAWNVSSEFDVLNYEVQRSTDGEHFSGIGSQLSKGNSFVPVAYQWKDPSLTPGYYYYRIKAITARGIFIYSNIAKVILYKNTPAVYVFPNPVTANFIQLRMSALPAGLYSIRLFNDAGQLVANDIINHSAGTATEYIDIKRRLSKGSYKMEISGKGFPGAVLKVMIQ
ncbi:MAG: hypothetical protein IPP72_21830 [Chitinophagaceae bacterium]|nr:hypothetical protein [Chitinophagaceae bacterium]